MAWCGRGRRESAEAARGGAAREHTVIRQAISCDICGTEKRQTNHWFVAYEQAGELRVSPWGSRNRLRPGMKHLCGQTCLHKLVDDFMARSVAVRAQSPAIPEAEGAAPAMDASLTSHAAYAEFESSARLLPPVEPERGFKPQAELVAMLPPALPSVDALRYAARSRHAEAWERERAREMRATERQPEIARRRSRA